MLAGLGASVAVTLLDLSEDERLLILRGCAGLEGNGAELEGLQTLRAAALQLAEASWSAADSEAFLWVVGACRSQSSGGLLVRRSKARTGYETSGERSATLLFLESAGELLEADKIQISRHPAIRNSLEELVVELSDKDLRGKRQGCQLLVSQVCVMERLVVCGKGAGDLEAIKSLDRDLAGLLQCKDISLRTQALLATKKVKTISRLSAMADDRGVCGGLPKVVAHTELAQLRERFEAFFYSLPHKLMPANAMLEQHFDGVDNGEFQNLSLKEFASRED
ncbi:unnamed protein product, partial [Symbiodinium necroappetens]